MAVGNPHLVNTFVNCIPMTLAVAVLMGMASGYLVARSIQVNRNLNPPFTNGKGPTILMATLPNGMATTSLACIILCLGWFFTSFGICQFSDMVQAVSGDRCPMEKGFIRCVILFLP